MALDLFSQLQEQFDDNEDLFARERVTREKLGDPGVRAHAMNMKHRRANWNRSIGNFDEAIDDLSTLLVEIEAEPQIARQVGLNERRVNADITYYTKLRDSAE